MPHSDPWRFLQTHTAARIAQGRVGHSLPTHALLDFQLDHARARDAVYSTLDTERLLEELARLVPEPLLLRSQATDRPTYLRRPDWGRQLSAESGQVLRSRPATSATLSFVIADGLSATAINRHAVTMVAALADAVPKLGWTLAPIALVEQGRVAIGDAIAHALGAELLVVLIGERPGLSASDSMGAYLTYQPRPGLTDESRNCVSNIRDSSGGMVYGAAVQKLLYLLTEMKTRRLSGVGLKDEMPTHTLPHSASPATTVQIPETPD